MQNKLKVLSLPGILFSLLLLGCKKDNGVHPFHTDAPVVISNFEVANTKIYQPAYDPITGVQTNSDPTKWPSDWQQAAMGTNNSPYPSAPGGGNYVAFVNRAAWGSGGNATNPYISYLTITAQNSDSGKVTDKYFPVDYVNPDNVYFNIWVYNPGGLRTNSVNLAIGFAEDPAIVKGVYSKRVGIANPNWIGWKLLSWKYSEIPAFDQYNNSTVARGNPNIITSIGFTLLTTQGNLGILSNRKPLSIGFDRPTFSYNLPLKE